MTTSRGADGALVQCVYFAEFDNALGPVVSHQHPPASLSPEFFDSISEYVITKPQLSGKVMTVTVGSTTLMGCPMCIEDQKYHRNALLFNVGFVLATETALEPLEKVCLKLAQSLATLERESELVSQHKDRINDILVQCHRGLNSRGECVVPVDTANTIRLKLVPTLARPMQVQDYHVPVRIRDLDALVTRDWDLTLQQIVPFVDGVLYVAKIAKEADVDIRLAKEGIRHLLYYGCVTLIDIFQYSNMYTTTPSIRRLAVDETMQSECIRYVTKRGKAPPPFSKVFSLYCSLQPGMTMRDFCTQHETSALNIDDRRFITFGLINKLLRRIHKYPTYAPPSTRSLSDVPPATLSPDLFGSDILLDGTTSLDAICCETNRSANEIESVLAGGVVLCK